MQVNYHPKDELYSKTEYFEGEREAFEFWKQKAEGLAGAGWVELIDEKENSVGWEGLKDWGGKEYGVGFGNLVDDETAFTDFETICGIAESMVQ